MTGDQESGGKLRMAPLVAFIIIAGTFAGASQWFGGRRPLLRAVLPAAVFEFLPLLASASTVLRYVFVGKITFMKVIGVFAVGGGAALQFIPGLGVDFLVAVFIHVGLVWVIWFRRGVELWTAKSPDETQQPPSKGEFLNE